MNNEQNKQAIRANFQNLSFWNPTKIYDHEINKKIHRMDLNECPYPPSPNVLAAIQNISPTLNRYPDGTCPMLTPLIAKSLGVDEETIKRVDNVWASGQFTDEEMSWIMLMLIIPKAHHLIKNSDEWRNFQAEKKGSVH